MNLPFPRPLAVVFSALCLLATACQAPTSAPETSAPPSPTPVEQGYYRPLQQLDELFVAVQLQPIFEDSKTFVDSRPRQAPGAVLASYRAQNSQPGFDLKAFVQDRFVLPDSAGTAFRHQVELPMQAHLRQHWDYLTRQADADLPYSSLIPLPHPYVVPGGRFREIYYWDSYFTMLGLAQSERLDLVESMLNNFAWMVDQLGHIPNGNRSYYLSRSQPPFFAAMVDLFAEHKGDRVASRFLTQLEKEYAFWMAGAENLAPGQAHRRVVRLPDGSLLNRYYDDLSEPRPESYREDVATAEVLPPAERGRLYRDLRAAAESGWDFSSRWLADRQSLASVQTTEIVPVDLNSLLYNLERAISRLHASQGDTAKAEAFAARAEDRSRAINRWLWDKSQGIYGDYHLSEGQMTGVASLATVYPLYFGLAPEARANTVAGQLRDQFLKPGGLVTTLNNTGEQWDYPNGWAPLQWLAIKGLRNYGENELAEQVAERWIALNRKVYQNTGRMMEKYNVVDTDLAAGGGEYPLQDGFGWTNGVALAILAVKERPPTRSRAR